MNQSNYILFEILKFKIELLDCLEYSMETCTETKHNIKKKISYLKNNFENGMYKEIISSLFTDHSKVNSSVSLFFKKFSYKKTIKIVKSKKITTKIKYIKQIIDCQENIKNIMLAFTSEKDIYFHIDSKIKKLIDTSNLYFIYFLYFILYSMYIGYLFPERSTFKSKENDIREITSMIKYCNNDNIFNDSIEILKSTDEAKINNELEALSNKCIKLHNKQIDELKEVINLLNNELEKSKKQ